MSEAGDVTPVIRRVPVGLSQFATYVKSEPGEYDISVHTKLQSSKGYWTLTGVDVSLSAGGDLLQPLLRSLEPDHPSELLIVADTVRVENAIMLPGTHVRIQARVLEFADGAQINTQATAYTDAEIPKESGAPGRYARHSGPVELYVSELNILGQDNQPVIVTDGTDGTVGGPGDKGMDGDDVLGIDFESSEGSAIQSDVNTHRQWVSIRDKGLELSKTGAVVSVTVRPNPEVFDDRTIQHPNPKPNLNGRDPREDGPEPKKDPDDEDDKKTHKHLPGVAGRGAWAG